MRKLIQEQMAAGMRRCGRWPVRILVPPSMREEFVEEALEQLRYFAPKLVDGDITDDLLKQYLGVTIEFTDEAIDGPYAIFPGRD